MQGQARGHVVDLNAATLRASMWLMVREGGAERSEGGERMAPTALNKLSPYGAPACLTPWMDKRACAAYLGGCVYSGKCAGQVASLEAGF